MKWSGGSNRCGSRLSGEVIAKTTVASPSRPGADMRVSPTGKDLFIVLGLLGLRDKVSFLGARPEIYATMLVVGLFPIEHWVVAWQFVFLFIWWGRHPPWRRSAP